MATASETPADKATTDANFHPYSLLAPRFWHGMLLSTWLRHLARNRFAISVIKLPMVLAITFFTSLNVVYWLVQELVYGRRADKTEIKEAPVFILGHWRSGTTLLHELLVLDDRHTYPTTYQCFAPNHFLLTERLFTPLLAFLLPSQRPMDNMATGWHRPQEDEFALCNMGIGSMYVSMMFPNRPPQYREYLDLKGLSAEELVRWKGALLWFLRRVTLRDPRRIVLKSPPHTARIETLLELFPDARFVHIVRDPYVIFPSTMRLWTSLNEVQGLQVSRDEGLEEYVLDCFERMYASFDAQRELIGPSRFYEVRYEDLVRDPVEQMRRIYEQLELGDFDRAAPKMQAYWEDSRGYRTNRYRLPPEIHAKVTERWGSFIRKYGYSTEPAEI